MIDPDHAKRVLEHLRDTPVEILAKHYSRCEYPSPASILEAEIACKKLVDGGYAIEPIEDDE